MEISRGGAADAPLILAMLDGAVAWLVRNGRPGQWGTEPWSASPRKVERVNAIARDEDVWIARVDGRPAGVMATGPAPPDHVPAAGEPELYIGLLVTDREFAGHGVGSALIAHALDQARRLGVDLVRVDCYGGDDGRLIEYYRKNGFAPVRTFEVGEWPGQLLSQRVGGPPSSA